MDTLFYIFPVHTLTWEMLASYAVSPDEWTSCLAHHAHTLALFPKTCHLNAAAIAVNITLSCSALKKRSEQFYFQCDSKRCLSPPVQKHRPFSRTVLFFSSEWAGPEIAPSAGLCNVFSVFLLSNNRALESIRLPHMLTGECMGGGGGVSHFHFMQHVTVWSGFQSRVQRVNCGGLGDECVSFCEEWTVPLITHTQFTQVIKGPLIRIGLNAQITRLTVNGLLFVLCIINAEPTSSHQCAQCCYTPKWAALPLKSIRLSP